MKVKETPHGVTLWLSADDTYRWAHKSGASWPCSTLSGKRLCASFDSKGLCVLTINGRDGDCDASEFNAITSDHLAAKLSKTNPAYFVAVEQFQR